MRKQSSSTNKESLSHYSISPFRVGREARASSYIHFTPFSSFQVSNEEKEKIQQHGLRLHTDVFLTHTHRSFTSGEKNSRVIYRHSSHRKKNIVKNIVENRCRNATSYYLQYVQCPLGGKISTFSSFGTKVYPCILTDSNWVT